MDYFLISQDPRYHDQVEPIIPKAMLEEAPCLDSNLIVLEIKEKSQVEYVDFIERPILMSSDALKQLLQLYEPELVFAPLVLNDAKRGLQNVYWRFAPPLLDCQSSKTEFHKNGAVKRLVLNAGQVTGKHLFQVDRLREPLLVFDLMLVESMLRRGLSGFQLARIELDGEQVL